MHPVPYLQNILIALSNHFTLLIIIFIARKVSKYGVVSGPYFPVLGLKTRKYGPEKTPHLYVSHVVITSKPHLPLSLA